uniref:Secreted protein n=1 Tax=Angiostrongylus cantonensis TaxID=6313 RepID=A0A0K0DRQ4_ANGCA
MVHRDVIYLAIVIVMMAFPSTSAMMKIKKPRRESIYIHMAKDLPADGPQHTRPLKHIVALRSELATLEALEAGRAEVATATEPAADVSPGVTITASAPDATEGASVAVPNTGRVAVETESLSVVDSHQVCQAPTQCS